MNPILAAGVLIGVLCAVWTFVMGLTGWYKDPVMAGAFFVVVPIEIAGLVWGLRRTAAEGRTYLAQVVAGTLMAVVAGVIIIVSSLLFTMVAYPDYFAELEAVERQLLEAAGRSPAEIEATIEAERSGKTPMAYAMSGFLGTLITGIVASAVTAVFVRKK